MVSSRNLTFPHVGVAVPRLDLDNYFREDWTVLVTIHVDGAPLVDEKGNVAEPMKIPSTTSIPSLKELIKD